MKQSQWIAVFFTLALLFCFAMPAGAFEIGARALYWFPSFKADIRVDDSGVTGDNINLKDTLGVEDESFPSFEALRRARKASPERRLYADGLFGIDTAHPEDHLQRPDLRRRQQSRYGPEAQDARSGIPVYLPGYGKHPGRFLARRSSAQIKYIDGEAKINAPASNTGSDFNVPRTHADGGARRPYRHPARPPRGAGEGDRHRLFRQLPLRGAGRSLLDPLPVSGYPCRI